MAILAPLSVGNSAQLVKRDEFALELMKHLMRVNDDDEGELLETDYRAYCDLCAESAYEMADAMMRARARTPDFGAAAEEDGA